MPLRLGNHDGSGAIKNNVRLFERERELAKKYWQKHNLDLDFIDRANFPFYYSFEQKNVFFLVWDASTAKIDSQQLEWIEPDSGIDTSATGSFSHRFRTSSPIYPVTEAKNKPGEYLGTGSKLRSRLQQNHVLMYVSGHHHVYYPGKIDGLKLLHAGALGQGARQLINSQLPPTKTVTTIDIDLTESEVVYTTYNANTWQKVFIEKLPTFIPSQDGKIWRDDL